MVSSKPNSPSKKEKRRSLLDQFPNLNISTSSTSAPTTLKLGAKYCLKGSFSKGWPPSRGIELPAPGGIQRTFRDFTLSMSEDYRFYPDEWRTSQKSGDKPADVSIAFQATQEIISEITSMLNSCEGGENDMEAIMFDEMAKAIYGSNNIDRVGLGLDETFRLCIAIFQGAEDLEYTDRSDEYQEKLDKYVSKNLAGGIAVIRNRREVVQHAAAFQHLINAFVKQDQPMTEELIKITHRILTMGLDPADSGNFNYKSFGGTYRTGSERAFGGAFEYAKPSSVAVVMKSMVVNLQADIAHAQRIGLSDPFMLAAKYCDRFVNIHPFKDANGRMCRLILNAIFVKFAGIIVALEEKGAERDEYLEIAAESTKVGGHPGQLGKKVLEIAGGTLRRLKNTLSRHMKESSKKI